MWVADSFGGLPPPNPEEYPAVAGLNFHEVDELAVSREEVERNFELVATLAGDATEYVDASPEAGLSLYAVRSLCGGPEGQSFCTVNLSTPKVLRGDVDNDDAVSGLADGIFLLTFGFLNGAAPPCMAQADVDAGGVVSGLLDSLYLLDFAFAGGPIIPAPYPDCGDDAVGVGSLGCEVDPACSP